ncbi:MAG: hypothetical protein FWG80_04735 [Alphaproteobacteria bacterium]|nr:hypothetical protein [Alphaproteobacteria bacterium]
MKNEKNILILASGGGTNAESIVKNAKEQSLDMRFIGGCNRSHEKAGVYKKLENLGVKVNYIPSPGSDFSKLREFLNGMPKFDLIVLAGYMRILPVDISNNYNIVNIHPSILPFVYKGSQDAYLDALDNEDKYTGCTVHKVTSEVDSGPRLGQIAFEIPEFVTRKGDLDMLKSIGLAHEHALYFKVITGLLSGFANTNALMQLDMEDIARHAHKNLKERDLPRVRTYIPNNGLNIFKEFHPKQNCWLGNVSYCR